MVEEGMNCAFHPRDGGTAREWCPRLRPEVLERDLGAAPVELTDLEDPGSARVWSGDVVLVARILDKGTYALCWHNRRRDLLLIGVPDLVKVWLGNETTKPLKEDGDEKL